MRAAEVRIARKTHSCTRCGGVIGSGEEYERRATPPWLLGPDWAHWEIVTSCYGCRGGAA